MTLPTALAVAVIVFALPLNWYVTARLWYLSRRTPRLWVLRERAIQSLATAVIVTVFAVIFVNNELDVPFLNAETTMVISRTAVLVLSVVPALYWMFRVRRS